MAFQTLDFTFTTIVVGSNLISNGDFASDTLWTKGTGWTIAAGVGDSDASQAADSDLTQAPSTALVEGFQYEVIFTAANRIAGAVTVVVGDTEGTDRTTNATFTETIVAGAGADLDIRADLNWDGDVDDVSITAIEGVSQTYRGGPATAQISAGTFGSGRASVEVSFDGGLRFVPLKDVNGTALTTLSADAFFNINIGPCSMRVVVDTATITTGQLAIRSMFDTTTGS